MMSTPPNSLPLPLPSPPSSSSLSPPPPLSSSPPKASVLSPRDSSSSSTSGTPIAAVRISSPLNPNSSSSSLSPRLSGLNLAFPTTPTGTSTSNAGGQQVSPTSSSSAEEVFKSRPQRLSLSSLKKPLSRGVSVSPARGRTPASTHSSPASIVHSFSSPGPAPGQSTRSLPTGTRTGHSSPRQTGGLEERGSRMSLPDDLSTFSREGLISSFSRSRSRSRKRGSGSRDVSPVKGIVARTRNGTNTPPNTPPRSWWGSCSAGGGGAVVAGHHRRGLTKEEEQVWIDVRKRVLKATISTLGTLKDLTREALELGVEFLDLVPVPGLAPAARLVLDVWNAVEEVDMNRLASLRLAERCADILLSVRLEVKEAGDVVGEELSGLLQRLEQSFKQVLEFLQKNNRRPLLKRYLKRDEILREISGLDTTLRDALGMFGLSVQIRILKQVQESEKQRQKDTHAIIEHLIAQQHGSGDTIHTKEPFMLPTAESENALHLTLDSPTAAIPPLDMLDWSHPVSAPLPTPSFHIPSFPVPMHSPLSPEEITTALQQYHHLQNNEDLERDTESLRELLRMLVQGSDVEIVDAMGIGRGEMVEAVKTLQRALEKEREKERELEIKDAAIAEEKPELVRRMSLTRRGSTEQNGVT